MFVLIGGAPKSITLVTDEYGHDSVPPRFIGSTTISRENSGPRTRPTPRRRFAFLLSCSPRST